MTGKETLDDYKDFGKIKGESTTSNQTFTSKEALRILSECANGEKKLLFSDSLDLEQIVSKRLEKLEKLERAFEILKEVLVIPEDDDIDFYVNDRNYYKLKFTQRLINENEKELLEELTKSE